MTARFVTLTYKKLIFVGLKDTYLIFRKIILSQLSRFS